MAVSALILGADDGNDPSQPIDLEKCGKDCLKYVVVLNCWELNAGERIYNVTDPYFTRRRITPFQHQFRF